MRQLQKCCALSRRSWAPYPNPDPGGARTQAGLLLVNPRGHDLELECILPSQRRRGLAGPRSWRPGHAAGREVLLGAAAARAARGLCAHAHARSEARTRSPLSASMPASHSMFASRHAGAAPALCAQCLGWPAARRAGRRAHRRPRPPSRAMCRPPQQPAPGGAPAAAAAPGAWAPAAPAPPPPAAGAALRPRGAASDRPAHPGHHAAASGAVSHAEPTRAC